MSRVRGRVLTFAFLLAVVTYLDRICISAAAPFMMEDLHLTVLQMGAVFSAFTLAYSIFEIPSGWLGDTRGPRLVLTRIVLWWSGFTMLTAAAQGFASLVSIRFLFGAGEAGAFPNIARSFSRWFPRRERGTANGVLFLGSRVGGMLSAPIALLLIRRWGWRASFVAFGTLGIVWAAAWYAWYRDRPSDHPGITAEELAWIEQDRGATGEVRRATGEVRGAAGEVRGATGEVRGAAGEVRRAPGEVRGATGEVRGAAGEVRGATGEVRRAAGEVRRAADDAHALPTPWRLLIASRNLHAICAMYFAFGYGLYFYFTWLPTFLIRVLGFSLFAGGLFAALPFVLAGLADLVGGWLTDRLARTHGLRVARCGLGFTAFLTCAALVVASTLAPQPVARAVLLALALASADLALGACWAVPLDVGADHAGVVTGFMNTFGNLGGLAGPLVVGLAVDRWHSWTFPFYVTALVYAAGAVAWLAIDPNRQIRGELTTT